MTEQARLTEIDGPMLAMAFPTRHHSTAALAGKEVARLLSPRQWTERFAVQCMSETILIPARLDFASNCLALLESDEEWRFVRALQTRSNDGFVRQRAAWDLLSSIDPWAAPFIVALIGEYIVEILDDIFGALTPELERMLAAFIVDNEPFWATTKRRVTSYWNAYYRVNWASETRRVYRHEEYVGFKLIQRLESVTMACNGDGSGSKTFGGFNSPADPH